MAVMDLRTKNFDMSSRELSELPQKGLWVFGYGSLMWRPDFYFTHKILGRCSGVRRSFCVWSIYHRGTVHMPGLVLGLENGGVCDGVLYYVPASHQAQVLDYLRKREQITKVYVERFKGVDLLDGSGRCVRALCFMANRLHPRFSRNLSVGHQAKIIRCAKGRSGGNLDYLISTVQSLKKLNIEDDHLRRILVSTMCAHKLSIGGNKYL